MITNHKISEWNIEMLISKNIFCQKIKTFKNGNNSQRKSIIIYQLIHWFYNLNKY